MVIIYQFSSIIQSCLILCDPMDCSTPDFPVHHKLLEFTQIHVHWIGDAVQPSHPLSSPSPLALNLYQNQSLFKWVSSSHQVARVLEFQLQHLSFQWLFRTMHWLDLLAVQWTLKSFLQHHSSKASILTLHIHFAKVKVIAIYHFMQMCTSSKTYCKWMTKMHWKFLFKWQILST